MYKVLTDELLADELIAGQPSFSADYMRKVQDSSLIVHDMDCLTAIGIIGNSEELLPLTIRGGAYLQMLDYNVPGGKLNRGLAVADILGHLQQDKARFTFKLPLLPMYMLYH